MNLKANGPREGLCVNVCVSEAETGENYLVKRLV